MENQMTSNGQSGPDKIHSKMVRAGSKNYFFDVKMAKSGNNYLTIADSYKDKNGQNVTSRVIVFKEHLEAFKEALREAEGCM